MGPFFELLGSLLNVFYKNIHINNPYLCSMPFRNSNNCFCYVCHKQYLGSYFRTDIILILLYILYHASFAGGSFWLHALYVRLDCTFVSGSCFMVSLFVFSIFRCLFFQISELTFFIF